MWPTFVTMSTSRTRLLQLGERNILGGKNLSWYIHRVFRILLLMFVFNIPILKLHLFVAILYFIFPLSYVFFKYCFLFWHILLMLHPFHQRLFLLVSWFWSFILCYLSAFCTCHGFLRLSLVINWLVGCSEKLVWSLLPPSFFFVVNFIIGPRSF